MVYRHGLVLRVLFHTRNRGVFVPRLRSRAAAHGHSFNRFFGYVGQQAQQCGHKFAYSLVVRGNIPRFRVVVQRISADIFSVYPLISGTRQQIPRTIS